MKTQRKDGTATETETNLTGEPRRSTIRPTTDRFESPREDVPRPPHMPSDIRELGEMHSEDRLEIRLPPELVRDLRSIDGPIAEEQRAVLVDRIQTVLNSSMRPPAMPMPLHDAGAEPQLSPTSRTWLVVGTVTFVLIALLAMAYFAG